MFWRLRACTKSIPPSSFCPESIASNLVFRFIKTLKTTIQEFESLTRLQDEKQYNCMLSYYRQISDEQFKNKKNIFFVFDVVVVVVLGVVFLALFVVVVVDVHGGVAVCGHGSFGVFVHV